MRIYLKETKNGESIEGLITRASKDDLPLKKNGWQFSWKTLEKTVGAQFYKLTTVVEPDTVEGMLMLTLINEEMLYIPKSKWFGKYPLALLPASCVEKPRRSSGFAYVFRLTGRNDSGAAKFPYHFVSGI